MRNGSRRSDGTVLLRNIARLVTLDHGDDAPRCGSAMGDLAVVDRAAVAVRAGRILEYGPERALVRRYRGAAVRDAEQALVLPGLVDPHTHPVFAANRVGDFKRRLAGATYQEIAAAGGGILSSVRAVREASDARLRRTLEAHLLRLGRHGVALAEAKSGYGLSLRDEVRMLEAIGWWNRRRADAAGIWLVPTCLAAHSVPPEYRGRRADYVELVIGSILPAVRRRHLAERADVFCEEGVFSVAESRRILTAARDLGLRLTVHADQLSALGGGALAAELGADSADHLEYADRRTIAALARAGTAAVLLPGSTFFLQMKRWAPARKMIDSGVVVALATDFNPGSSPVASPAACMTLACLHLKMTPEECVTAFTLNAAYALRMQAEFGSIRPGKRAVFSLWRAEEPAEIAYAFGDNLCEGVWWV
ncbi:MAG: imidazolonepropionase [Planctomycetes bacterium]|nr:imidazolonepropionase [Planctomycetota bacterium]